MSVLTLLSLFLGITLEILVLKSKQWSGYLILNNIILIKTKHTM